MVLFTNENGKYIDSAAKILEQMIRSPPKNVDKVFSSNLFQYYSLHLDNQTQRTLYFFSKGAMFYIFTKIFSIHKLKTPQLYLF